MDGSRFVEGTSPVPGWSLSRLGVVFDDSAPGAVATLLPNVDEGVDWLPIELLGDLDDAPDWLDDAAEVDAPDRDAADGDAGDPGELTGEWPDHSSDGVGVVDQKGMPTSGSGGVGLVASVPAGVERGLTGDAAAPPRDEQGPSTVDLLGLVAAAAPGPGLVELLAAVAERDLTPDQWLSVVQGVQPALAWLAGVESRALAGVAGPKPAPPEDPGAAVRQFDPAALEVAAALDCGQDFARDKVETARVLHGLLANTGAALEAGRLDAYRARLLVQAVADLTPAQARAVEDLVLPKAGLGQPRDFKRRIALAKVKVNAAAVIASFLDGVKGRRVVFDDGAGDGLVGMHTYLPPVTALAVRQQIETAAGRQHPGDDRCRAEREADIVTGAILGFKHPTHTTAGQAALKAAAAKAAAARTAAQAGAGSGGVGSDAVEVADADGAEVAAGAAGEDLAGVPWEPLEPQVRVNITVDLPTLLGLRNNVAELTGFGPIPAELARVLAVAGKDPRWRRLVYDPANGH